MTNRENPFQITPVSKMFIIYTYLSLDYLCIQYSVIVRAFCLPYYARSPFLWPSQPFVWCIIVGLIYVRICSKCSIYAVEDE